MKRRKQLRRWLMIGGGLLAVALVAGAVSRLEPAVPAVDRAAVWTDTVRRGEMLRQVRGPGVLVPRDIRWIAATTEARVERLLVRPGARVDADTVLVELSNPTLSQQVQEARSRVVAAEADYAVLEAQLESNVLDQRATLANAQAEYESARLQAQAEAELLKDGIIPRIQYQRSELTAEQRRVRLDIEQQRTEQLRSSVEAQLRAARARQEQLDDLLTLREQQLEALQVRAGIDGVVQELPVEVGQSLTPGQNIARVARPDSLMAELQIAETQAKDVQLGQQVAIDTRNGVAAGKVTRIDPRVSNGTVQVDVELTEALPPGARPDLSVDGTILIERLDDVLYVGRPAYGQPEATVGLFRIDPATAIATRVPVALGRSSVNVIEVRQGLAEGDTVILSDTSAWDDRDQVRLE